ncbi:MAG: CotH kinase family protein [Eubacteriales bacterium]|nr:CotH kinase family protein [Eubacteriales bacterium]
MQPQRVYEDMMSARQSAQQPLLAELLYNEQPLPYDESTRTFYCPLLQDDDDPALVWKSSAGDVDIAFLQADVSAQTLRANHAYPFIACTATAYEEYFFVMTSLPILNIQTQAPAENPLRPIGNTDTDVLLTLHDNLTGTGPLQRLIVSQAQMHIRGGSSRRYPKLSYRISLTENTPGDNRRARMVSLLGMRQDDDWILYAPYNDPERMRNTLSTNLWYDACAGNNSFAMKAGTQGQFVEVLINGRYWGIYTLMHPVDAKQLELAQTQDAATTEYCYRAYTYAETTPAMLENLPTADAAGSNIKPVVGGYELKYPKRALTDEGIWTPLAGWLTVIQGSDDVLRTQLFTAGEKDNLIDIWLFLQMTMAADSDGKNLNFAAKLHGDKVVMLISPWDLDQTWGNIWTEGAAVLTEVRLDPETPMAPQTAGISRALKLQLPGLSRSIVQRYAQLRATTFSDANLLRLLAAYEEDIYGSGAIARDYERWPDSAYAADTRQLQELILRRMAYMDGCIAGLEGGGEYAGN